MNLVDLAESGWIPDPLLRVGIRRLIADRARQIDLPNSTAHRDYLAKFIAELKASPLAVHTHDANRQHYEVPAEFFAHVLGPHLKYSGCLWDTGAESLAAAEEQMLRLTCHRAEIDDGMRVLDLGCGWGSVALYIARRFPATHVTAISNSHSQREFIERRCRELDLNNVVAQTCDVVNFEPNEQFDRVVSVEMFEHFRNYAQLLENIAGWLHCDGKLFVHVFCHRDTPYFFETTGATNWMARNFFTGGTMPSDGLFHYFPKHLQVEAQWSVQGLNYARTCDAWLSRLDQHRRRILPILADVADAPPAKLAFQRWRLFFMACAELFRYRGGDEWYVSHYRFAKPTA